MISIDDWKAKGEYFLYDKYRIFFIAEGYGDPLLLIHGFPTSSWDWNKVWDPLTKKYRVITLDMIGFGYSDKPPEYDYRIFNQADIIKALLSYLDVQKAHILAHDYGDTVAQELLYRQNNSTLSFNIKSCVMLNGGLFHGVHKPRAVQKILLTPIGSWVQRYYTKRMFARTFHNIFGKDTPPSDVEINSFWGLMNHNKGRLIFYKLIKYLTERKTFQKRWLCALQKSKAPIRLIDGVDDPISGRHLVEHYARVIPDPDIVSLEGIGHYPQTESPQKVLDYYFQFRAKVGLA